MMNYPVFLKRTPLVVHRALPYDVYIGRPTWWGNKFSHLPNSAAEFKVESRLEAVYSYANWLKTQPQLLQALPTLHGKVLGCWCDRHQEPFNPLKHACHGHVLAWLANPEMYR